jgi:predicted nuclease of predicted toxin-antitoxin system
LPKKKSKKP